MSILRRQKRNNRVLHPNALLLLIIFSRVPAIWSGFACMDNPCLHGICIDYLQINSSHQCYCRNGFTGYSCQINWDECRSNPCVNGGICLDGVASFNCSCPDNFSGTLCEVDLSICEEVFPCQNNGTCGVDKNNVTGTGFICSCPPGFTGPQCEVDISVCNTTENVCQNGGKCIDGVGNRFFCQCEPGWSGETCHIDVDECESRPCQNGGICVNKINDFSCACPFGFTGRACETELRICDENPCLNGAFCLNEQNDESKKTCYCVPDYHGTLCEFIYDDCDPPPKCFNGGTCIDGVGEFTCSCPPGFFGHSCQCSADNVTETDCAFNVTTPWSKFSETTIFPLPLSTIDNLPQPTPMNSLPYVSSEDPQQTAEIVHATVTPSQEFPRISITSIPSASPYDPGGIGSAIQSSTVPASTVAEEPSTYATSYPGPKTVLYETSVLVDERILSETDRIYAPSFTVRWDGSDGSLVSETTPEFGESSVGFATPAITLELHPQASEQSALPKSTITFLRSLTPSFPDVDSDTFGDTLKETTNVQVDNTPFPSPLHLSTETIEPSVPVLPVTPFLSETITSLLDSRIGITTADLTVAAPHQTIIVVEETASLPPPSAIVTPSMPTTPELTEIERESESLFPVPEQTKTEVFTLLPSMSMLPLPITTITVGSEELITTTFIVDTPPFPSQSIHTPTIDPIPTPTLDVITENQSFSMPGWMVSESGMVIASPSIISSTVVEVESLSDEISSTPTVMVSRPFDSDSVTTVYAEPEMSGLITATPTPQLPWTTSTVRPNVTDPCANYCLNDAKCIADSIEPICLCSFKFTGNRCEERRERFQAASFSGDSFLSFRVPNDSIISRVDMKAKLVTIVPEGILLYTGVKRIYALIFTQNGHVTLHFSCGSQSMHFVETRTRVNNGFNFTLEFRMEMIVQGVNELRCAAEVSVNHSYIMKGEQVIGRDGVLLAEHPIETVFLGGVSPFHTDASLNDDLIGILPGFRGCIHSLTINQEERDVYEDALDGKEVADCTSFGCVANPCHGSARCLTTHAYPFWECICPHGYKGLRCQIIVCGNNPCQHGATCTYSQDSLAHMLNLTTGWDDTPSNSAPTQVSTTLLPLLLQPICLCPLGFSGSVCQQKLNVTKPAFQPHSGFSSYIAYEPIPRFIDWFQVKFHFVTKNISQISLLLYSGNDRGPQPLLVSHQSQQEPFFWTSSNSSTIPHSNSPNYMGLDQITSAHPEPASDFFAITFLQGFIALTWNLGSGTQRITTSSRIDNRLNIHTLFAGRSGRQAWLKVDGMRNVTGKTPGPLYRLNAESNELYIGGYKSYKFEGLSHDLPLHQGFQGCIFDLGFRVKNRLYLPTPVRGRNVNNCFEQDC